MGQRGGECRWVVIIRPHQQRSVPTPSFFLPPPAVPAVPVWSLLIASDSRSDRNATVCVSLPLCRLSECGRLHPTHPIRHSTAKHSHSAAGISAQLTRQQALGHLCLRQSRGKPPRNRERDPSETLAAGHTGADAAPIRLPSSTTINDQRTTATLPLALLRSHCELADGRTPVVEPEGLAHGQRRGEGGTGRGGASE